MKIKLTPVLALGLNLVLLSATQAQRMPQDSWYLAKEMKRYVEPGKFHHPHDAALGPDGNLYVADRYNHRVQVFDQEGNFLRQFGNYGSGNGEFNELTGIHVAPDGTVYVSEWHNARVQVFDAQGKFIRSMGQAGSGEGQLNGPHGVTVDNDGNVYVAEHNNSRVSAFKPDGTYLRQWGSSGTADGQFQGVIAICRTPDNKIAVLERDGSRRIQVFEPDGTLLRKFTTEWSPHGIETDSSGNFYVTAREWAGFSVFDAAGTRTAVHGHNGGGSGDGQFNPMGLAVGNGKVFACDWNNHRIAVFSTAGSWIKNTGTHQSAEQDTHGIAVDASGNIFISYHQANVIYKFSPDLTFIKSFGSAGSGDGQFNGVLEMAIGSNQRLYVVDHSGHRVQYFDLEGNFLGKFGGEGGGNGKFKFPWGIAVGKDDKVYVADRDNHRIQIFDANGNYLNKFGTQGSFDGQFQSPHGLAIAPNGKLAVADAGNKRLQFFGGDFNFSSKISWPGHPSYSTGPYRVSFSSDGLAYLQGQAYYYWNGDKIIVFDQSGGLIKEWGSAWCSMAETKSGDLIAAHGDRVVRVWKRTFRTVHPEPANALPLPTIVSQKRRPGTSLVDVEYTVKDADNTTVQTAALAFKNGGNSLADVIPITSLAEGTSNKLGSNIATGQTHKFTWDVARDWSTDFGEVQLEILAKDGRGLLNLDFVQIPAAGDEPNLKISRSPLNDSDFLSVWYWLIATGDPSVTFNNGAVTFSSSAPSITTVPGLWVTYYKNWDFSGSTISRVETSIDFSRSSVDTSSSQLPDGWSRMSARFVGYITPPSDGMYSFYINGDDYVSWIINGESWNRDWGHQSIYLKGGVPAPIIISYDDRGAGWRSMNVTWAPPNQDWSSVSGSYFSTPINVPNPSGSELQQSYGRYASGTTTTSAGRAFLFQKMGLREATAAEVTRAKEAGTPGVINQWDPKLRVGPDERPAKINAYGFDTGADGYWVVPVTSTSPSN
jgi:sugar lactone lactonase YvrE